MANSSLFVYMDAVEQGGLSVVYELENQFAEERIGPSKPGTSVVGGIVFIERFVHNAGIAVGLHEHANATFNLFIVGGGEGFHHDAHLPRIIGKQNGECFDR